MEAPRKAFLLLATEKRIKSLPVRVTRKFDTPLSNTTAAWPLLAIIIRVFTNPLRVDVLAFRPNITRSIGSKLYHFLNKRAHFSKTFKDTLNICLTNIPTSELTFQT